MTVTPDQMAAMCGDSIVRRNLLTRPNYSPYCGRVDKCPHYWPRTTFDGEQFTCRCGFRTQMPADFIAFYKANKP